MQVVETIVSALIASGVGGVLGGLITWGGIRVRIEHLEQSIENFRGSVVFRDVCEQCRKNIGDRQTGIEEDLKEIKSDIKELLKYVG